jgi:TolB protein
MIRFRRLAPAAAAVCLSGLSTLSAQDTTFRGITIGANYDPLRDKIGVVVLPVTGAFGDSVRTIVQRDLDFSDRFTVAPIDTTDPGAFRAATGSGLNYALFARLGASAVVQISVVGGGLHVALHDVAKRGIANVGEFSLAASGLSRDWRLGVHRVSDEIERWMTGQRGIAATRVAYMRGNAIRVVDSDGASEITVPTEENGASPAWNPAGTMLTYATFGTASRLFLIDMATGRSRPLIGPTRNVIYVTPEFLPDGNTIVFGRGGENGTDLYLIGTNGGEPRRVTIGRGAVNSSPAPSPDGRRIAYVNNGAGHPELYITDADGTNADILTNYDFSTNAYRSDPDWSPDGRLVAYQERVNGRFQIQTIKVTGGTPKLLTSDGENEQPSWAPDSRHLVFTSTRTGVRQLWVMDTESGRVRQLTKSPGDRLASWSPRLATP